MLPPAPESEEGTRARSTTPDDGVSQIQIVMMLGLATVHAQNFFSDREGSGVLTHFLDTHEALALELLQQNSWWNYLCYFLQWAGLALLFCMYQDKSVSDRVCQYFGMTVVKLVSFQPRVTTHPAKSILVSSSESSDTSDGISWSTPVLDAGTSPQKYVDIPREESTETLSENSTENACAIDSTPDCPSSPETVVFTVGDIPSDGAESKSACSSSCSTPSDGKVIPVRERSLEECLEIFHVVSSLFCVGLSCQ